MSNITSLISLMPLRVVYSTGEVHIIFMDFINKKAYLADGSEVKDKELFQSVAKSIEKNPFMTFATESDDAEKVTLQALRQQEQIIKQSKTVVESSKKNIEENHGRSFEA